MSHAVEDHEKAFHDNKLGLYNCIALSSDVGCFVKLRGCLVGQTKQEVCDDTKSITHATRIAALKRGR